MLVSQSRGGPGERHAGAQSDHGPEGSRGPRPPLAQPPSRPAGNREVFGRQMEPAFTALGTGGRGTPPVARAREDKPKSQSGYRVLLGTLVKSRTARRPRRLKPRTVDALTADLAGLLWSFLQLLGLPTVSSDHRGRARRTLFWK